MWSQDIDDSEYCSKGGHPESRYYYDKWDKDVKKESIPTDCPLREESITVKLEEEK